MENAYNDTSNEISSFDCDNLECDIPNKYENLEHEKFNQKKIDDCANKKDFIDFFKLKSKI